MFKGLYERHLFVFVSLLFINIYCLNINVNADSAFPLRYVDSIFSGHPFLLYIQPGNRFFPEILYSIFAYAITDKLIFWSRIVIFINTVVLAHATYFLARSFNLERNISAYAVSFVLISIPVLNYLHQNVLIYFIFSPGIHGFLIPYIFYSLGFAFLILNGASNRRHLYINILLMFICVFSDTSFLLAVFFPVLAYIIIYFLIGGGLIKRDVFLWVASCLLGIILALAMKHVVPVLFSDHFNFLSVKYSLIGDDLKEWLEQNRLLKQLTSRTVSGYMFELILMTFISSISIVIIKAKINTYKPLVFLNIIYILWLPIFLYAMWAMDKTNIRLIPNILLISPILFTVNVVTLFKIKLPMGTHALLYKAIFIVALLGLLNTKYISMPYYQHQEVFDFLKVLKNKKIINKYGLADYWIANIDNSSEFRISPISSNGSPTVYASDIYKSWKWSNNYPEKNKFTFVVNMCNAECRLNEEKIVSLYGQYNFTKEFKQKKKKYIIYIYKDGLNSKPFYENLNLILNKYNIES